MVAYASTEEAPETQQVKYMAALNCTVASVPGREYVFVSTDANARTGKRGESGGETDSKVLGAYGRDELSENDKNYCCWLTHKITSSLLSSEHFLLHPQKWRIPYVPERQPQQGTSTFGLYFDKAGGPPTHSLR